MIIDSIFVVVVVVVVVVFVVVGGGGGDVIIDNSNKQKVFILQRTLSNPSPPLFLCNGSAIKMAGVFFKTVFQ